MKKRKFGELESQILYVLRSGKRQTVKDVQSALGTENKYTTIMTVMTRLFNKKFLEREKVGLQYEYWIADDFDSQSIFEKIKHNFLGIKTKIFVSQLIESTDDLTDDDLAELEEMIKKVRESKKQ